jgi:hypothetical protein
MNRRRFLALGAGGLAALGASPQEPSGFVVHEWGVVSLAYGSSVWGNARTAGAKAAQGAEVPSDLPPFVSKWEDHVREQIQDWQMQPVDKPVVYFYADRATEISVRVGVPAGRPKAWWPPASDFGPTFHGRPMRGFSRVNPEETRLENIKPQNGSVSWNRLTLDPSAGEFPTADGWWALAREVDATPLRFPEPPATLKFGMRRKPLSKDLPRAEKFLFYDALTPFDPGLEVSFGKETVEVTNRAHPSVARAFAIRVRRGECWFGSGANLAKDSPARIALAKGMPDLVPALVEAGLFRKEAESIVRIWSDEFFKVDGTRVLALLPQAAYDALLPIEIKPAPRTLVRTLIAHLECLDADEKASIRALAQELGSDEPQKRDAAAGRIKARMPLAESTVREVLQNVQDPEIRARLDDLLKPRPSSK